MSTQKKVLDEVYAIFESIEEWKSWVQINKKYMMESYIEQLVESVKLSGLIEPLTSKKYSSSEIIVNGKNYRETVRSGVLISRQRAVLKCIELAAQKRNILLGRNARIFAPEALTEFSLFLRGKYPRFIGSEFAPTELEKQKIYPILHQDLMKLQYEENVFDLIISNDVFEHVPDLDAALVECFRVLQPGGFLISTFPFLENRLVGQKKAHLQDGVVIYLAEPEFHGNPMDPEQGSLVFELPGWDILQRTKKVGFTDAQFWFISSAKHGIVGRDHAGILVFVARK